MARVVLAGASVAGDAVFSGATLRGTPIRCCWPSSGTGTPDTATPVGSGAGQEWTVGYGYRPWRAALWLAVCWLLGSLWFTYHQLPRLDSGQNPSWQPVIYAADLLVPVVNLGQDRLWRTSGASAWVAAGLTAVGWLLLSTAAAGVTWILTRR